MSKMRGIWASIPSPFQSVETVVESVNDAEHAVVQAGADFAAQEGLISEDTADGIVHTEEVVQGIRNAGVDVASGMADMINPVAMSASGPEMGQAMLDAYDKEGGGLDGVLGAVNVLNPAYHAMTAGYNAYEAAESGDYKAVGEEGAKCAVNVAATVGVAAGGAALAEGALGGGAADAAVADAAADSAAPGSDADAASEVAESSPAPSAPIDMPEPNFDNLSEAEMDAAFENAESGTYMELPGQEPETGQGLRSTKIRFDEDKPIAHHDDMEFKGIKDSPGKTVRVRRHSANDNAPDGTYAQDNPTTQVDSGGQYMLPDGTWKAIKDMTAEERAAAHME